MLLPCERGLSFEEVETAIEDGNLLDGAPHAHLVKLPGQSMMIVGIGEHVCRIPHVIDGSVRFLKTIYPSRKTKRRYGGDGLQEPRKSSRIP